MKLIKRDPTKRAKTQRWLAVTYVVFAVGYTVLAILGKKQRGFFISMSVMYFLIALLGLFLSRRTKSKISKNKD
jgi:quinol-cytochrome oxidoreductase complex cytochrome b subunit